MLGSAYVALAIYALATPSFAQRSDAELRATQRRSDGKRTRGGDLRLHEQYTWGNT